MVNERSHLADYYMGNFDSLLSRYLIASYTGYRLLGAARELVLLQYSSGPEGK